ncbi:DUF1761 domain-containing protein [Flavobacterium subsaxonicum]|uniref:DUF1761 domain-containing protein n=1 Tax=Flavobacterium subsaxonicum WB 4.1-42 = DSM 21790 TaxID=1121898 RepID=A0A0A2MRR2_9FLAO|nr:DUF1761 domain-containing protein [Flavobacterium subsaxonicum]KGO94256.1 hypothetical protein Q766_04850 [Flavobacterium subsaxonicum WB 4.1-42 = DSM 21790]
MFVNPWAYLVSTLIVLPVGFIWYNPKVFGTIWMREAGVNADAAKSANMFKIFGLTILFSAMATMMLQGIVVHQFGALSMIGGMPFADTAKPSYAAFMADYGATFRTFKHGMLHGAMTGLFLALPIIGTNSLFENKSWKYIWINVGYFIICFTLQGGVLSAWEN